MAIATTPTTTDTVLPGSYLDLLYKLLQDIDEQLRCRNQLASAWAPSAISVPLGKPGIAGVLLAAYDDTRLGLVIQNTDTSNTLYIGSTPGVGYPGGSNSNYMTILPQQSFAWNLSDADRNMPRYGLAGPGGPIVVAVSDIH